MIDFPEKSNFSNNYSEYFPKATFDIAIGYMRLSSTSILSLIILLCLVYLTVARRGAVRSGARPGVRQEASKDGVESRTAQSASTQRGRWGRHRPLPSLPLRWSGQPETREGAASSESAQGTSPNLPRDPSAPNQPFDGRRPRHTSRRRRP